MNKKRLFFFNCNLLLFQKNFKHRRENFIILSALERQFLHMWKTRKSVATDWIIFMNSSQVANTVINILWYWTDYLHFGFCFPLSSFYLDYYSVSLVFGVKTEK